MMKAWYMSRPKNGAAERRGIIGPMLPEEVVVRVVESVDQVSKTLTGNTIRTREAVVRETESKLGTVVPITVRDFHRGDIHEEVYRLQVFLNKAGYRCRKTGTGQSGKRNKCLYAKKRKTR